MKLTVIPSDRLVGRDGEKLFFNFLADPNIHAIQWDTDHGHVELINPRHNEDITEEFIAPFVAAYNTEKTRLDAVAAAELAFYNSPGQVALRQAEAARIAAKAQAFLVNLPSWAQVDQAVTDIANLADAKAFIRKLARIVYWLAKDRAD